MEYDKNVTRSTRQKVWQCCRIKEQSQYSLNHTLLRSMQRNTTVKQWFFYGMQLCCRLTQSAITFQQ